MNVKMRKSLILIMLVLSVSISLTACYVAPNTQAPTAEPQTGSNTTTEVTPAVPLTREQMLAKYDPEITLRAWRYQYSATKFAEGDNIEKNIYIDYYKQFFGINVAYDWVVPEDQFTQKLNIAVASGDLPDIMWLDNKNLIQMSRNNLLYDLTDLYENNTTDFTKSVLEQDITSFNTAKVDGRLMGIPYTGSAIDSLQILYVRTDWLDNLGLKMPTTMDELLNVAKAFTESDPDQNGVNDTYGLALTKDFIKDTHAGVTGFLAAYHGYVRRWIKNDAGELVYGTIQPEIKTGLAQLQQMYANGLIDPEFGVKDKNKVIESIAAGKIGITYGGMSTPGAFIKNSHINDPKAEWKAIPLVSADNKTAQPITKMPVNRYFAVNKDCKHPEAIMKLVEANSDGYARDSKEKANEWSDKLTYSPEGIAVFQYALVGYEPAKKNLIAHQNVVKALQNGDTSILNLEEQGYYDKIKQYEADPITNATFWGEMRIFGTPSSFDIIEQYVNTNDYLYDQFYGSLTPTMIEKKASLESMEDEVFAKIIMGQDINSFDKFVEDWKSLGGNEITKEVNAWYGQRK